MSEALYSSGGVRARRSVLIERAQSRVLILDDDRASRLVCRAYCDLFDYPSVSAGSLEEALSALRRRPFDVIVMSVHMERWGGVAAMRAVRALPAPMGELPIVALAAIGRADEAQRWRAAGFSAVVAKPVSAARLHAALRLAQDEPNARRSWAPAE